MAREKKMSLFYTIKIDTSMIVQNNFYVKRDFDFLKKNGLIISLAENQLIRFIRRIKNNAHDYKEIEKLNEKKRAIQRLAPSKKNGKDINNIQKQINELMFIPDLVSVRCNTTKQDYKDVCKEGFVLEVQINDTVYKMRYKRLCAGVGQLRRNTAFFINEEIHDELEAIMMCGLTKNKIGKINLAKFNACFSLYTSAVNKVKTPNVCVIDDLKIVLKNQKVSWIFDNSLGEKDIEERVVDFEINMFDGSGMVSPECAERWGENLTFDYTPCSFIIRAPFIKGLVTTFDFKKFAREVAHKDTITDIWGTVHNVDDIDVILTASQFKMYDRYDSWLSYMYYFKKYGHIFGISRTNKKTDDFMTTLNYQYIQSNDFTEEKIKHLADYTINWLKQIMSEDKLFTMLLMLGCQDEGDSNIKIEDSTDISIAKALIYEDSILSDKYVRQKIRKMIEKKVRKAKIGKLYVEGSYDFSIPDLYAMAEHAFGLEPKGILKEKQCWNKRWVDKGTKVVSIMRSPLVAPSENQLMNIYDDSKCQEWFKYVYSGNITNIHDMMAIRCSDADYDGDILLVTDNPDLVSSVNDNLTPITYEKKTAKKQRLNFNNFASMDIKSFNSKIGQITNLASSLISMLSDFPKGSKEYNEIRRRIDLLRFYQGSEIDKTKGIIPTPVPKEWSRKKKYLSIPDDADEQEKKRIREENRKIAFNNRICACVKPYFFGYIYDKEMKRYKEHKEKYERIARFDLQKSLSEVLSCSSPTSEESALRYNYYRYIPLKRSRSIMNILTSYVEDVEFDNRWRKSKKDFDYRVLMCKPNRKFNQSLVEQVRCELYSFLKTYQSVVVYNGITEEMLGEEFEYEDSYSFLYERLEQNLLAIISNRQILCDYIIHTIYTYYKSYNKSVLWQVFGDTIVDNLRNRCSTYYYPCESEDGVEYLGKKYAIKRGVTDKTVQRL